MVTCPKCKGKKEMEVICHQIIDGKKDEGHRFTMECVTCHGMGKITNSYLNAIRGFWCKCEIPPEHEKGEIIFYNDGEHPDVQKHHYRCAKCKRVVQVG